MGELAGDVAKASTRKSVCYVGGLLGDLPGRMLGIRLSTVYPIVHSCIYVSYTHIRMYTCRGHMS